MKINLNIVKELEDFCMHSNHRTAKIAAAIVYKNRIISKSCNVMKTHTFQRRFSRNENAIYFHAETGAIHKAIQEGFDKFNKCTMYIVRKKYSDSSKTLLLNGLAKPCGDMNCGCMSAIRKFNIKNVIYTLDEIEGIENHFGFITL